MPMGTRTSLRKNTENYESLLRLNTVVTRMLPVLHSGYVMVRAFFLINVQPSGSPRWPAAELKAIPGVKRVEEVSGLYDFLVEIESASRILPVSEMLMARPWVKRLHVLRPLDSRTETQP